VNVFQAIALLMTFVMLSTVGGILAAGLVIPVAAGASSITNGTTGAFSDLPTELEPGVLSEASYIYASDGTTLLARYYVENREVVPLDQISIHLQNAVIATEDRRFYSHGGVDPEGLARAAVKNATSEDTEGGSTLTQQYVKNVLIEKAKTAGDEAGIQAAKAGTIARKLREAKLAIALEKRMTKDEILAGYLNIAQFGASVYGVETAAKQYFGKSAADLSVIEAATIAGITQRPNTYDPIVYPEESERRRNIVLSLMYDQEYITKEEYDTARATPIADTLNPQTIQPGCEAAPGGSGYFCDYVTKVIRHNPVFGETEEERLELLYRGGLKIVTTINMGIQQVADEEVRIAVPQDNQYGFADAMTSVEPGTGKILAMAQNRDYSATANPPVGSTSVNYSADELYGGSKGFQPGSTFKTFVLAQWLREGRTLLTSVNAGPRTYTPSDFKATSCINFTGGGTWSPKNAEGRGSGTSTVLNATTKSINTAYATMSTMVDLCGVAEVATQVGFRPSITGTPVAVRMGMTLGSQETSPLSMAAAYATFASGGTYCDPIAILSVSADGQELPVPTANCHTALDTATANAVNYALNQVIAPNGGAPAARLAAHTGAGKTGTTNENRDAWFVGYTRTVSTAFWMGHPDNKQMNLQNVTIAGKPYSIIYGSTIAAPTWKRYMDRILNGNPDIPFEPIEQSKLGYIAPKPRPAPTQPSTPVPPSPEQPAPAAPPAPEAGN
jgi:membrane peptidoglycan carboxypeptidase